MAWELSLHLFSRETRHPETKRIPARSRNVIRCFSTPIFSLCVFAGWSVFVFAQNPAESAPPATLDASRIMPFLDQTLTWYRQMGVTQQIASDPSEVTIVTDNRQIATQIVRLSFDFARAEADAITSNQRSTPVQAQAGGTPEQQAMVKAEDQVDQQIKEAESELNSLKQKLATAAGKQRSLLAAQIAETQSELEVQKTRKDTIHNIREFATGAGGDVGGLKAQIDALAASIPTIGAAASPTGNQTNPKDQPNTNLEATTEESTGIWGLGAELFGVGNKLSTINNAITQTQRLAQASNDLRTPLSNRLRALWRETDQIANQPPAKDPAEAAQQRQQLDQLGPEFKQLAAIAIPLSKQTILFGLYQKSLENWHSEVRSDLKGVLERLLARLLILAIFIGFVLVLGEIGKRTIFRYVHEPHRRYQFLLLRKIALGAAITLIVALAFASRLDSAVTYAGLLTAGIAVALQNVIVAVVGYFFLIGRYGIRVGDRVQISGVTGEVVDIGLVRIQVMELGGSAADTPTGRVVAFSNSVVFQPTAGIFRQIPGTNFVWHEVSLNLAGDSDFKLARERLLSAVEGVLADYTEELDRQNRAMERNLLGVSEGVLKPNVQLRLTSTGLEAIVRFPVDLRHASEIDEKVTRELLKAVEQEPKLQTAGAAPAISLHTAASAK